MVESLALPQKTAAEPKSAKPGRNPDTLKIEGMGWEDAVKKSFTKKKPEGGWPK